MDHCGASQRAQGLLSNLFLQHYFLDASSSQNRLISPQQSCLLCLCPVFKIHLLTWVRKLKFNHSCATMKITAAFWAFLKHPSCSSLLIPAGRVGFFFVKLRLCNLSQGFRKLWITCCRDVKAVAAEGIAFFRRTQTLALCSALCRNCVQQTEAGRGAQHVRKVAVKAAKMQMDGKNGSEMPKTTLRDQTGAEAGVRKRSLAAEQTN